MGTPDASYFACAALLGVCLFVTSLGMPSEAERAARAYVYGLPIAMNHATFADYFSNKNSSEYKGNVANRFYHTRRLFTAENKSIVTPNQDTMYSTALLDLRGGPVVLKVPKVEDGRYYTVQLVDSNTYNFGYVGSRSTGNDEGSYAIAMDGWRGALPGNAKRVFYSSTPFAMPLLRVQVFSGADIRNVVDVQDGFELQTSDGKRTKIPNFGDFSHDMVDTPKFWDILDAALKYIPETRTNSDILREIGELGIGPFKRTARRSSRLEDGRALGKKVIEQSTGNMGSIVNGWKITAGGGNEKRYGVNWAERASVAQVGIYALDPGEAVYPFTTVDSEGRPLNGADGAYTITFDEKSFPPAKAFWSITAYDAKTRLFVENPIDRYLVNSTMVDGMKRAGGKVVIYAQTSSPGKELERNWLPIPKGPSFFVMRIYWPRVGGSSVLPVGRGTWKPPPVVRSGDA